MVQDYTFYLVRIIPTPMASRESIVFGNLVKFSVLIGKIQRNKCWCAYLKRIEHMAFHTNSLWMPPNLERLFACCYQRTSHFYAQNRCTPSAKPRIIELKEWTVKVSYHRISLNPALLMHSQSRIMTFDDSIQTHSHFASPFTVIWKKFCSCAQMVKLAYDDFLSNMAFNILLVSNVAEAC